MLKCPHFIPGKEAEKKAKCRGVSGSDIRSTRIENGSIDSVETPRKSCGKSSSGRKVFATLQVLQGSCLAGAGQFLYHRGSSLPGITVTEGFQRVTCPGLAELGAPHPLSGRERSADRTPGQLGIWFPVYSGYSQ